MAAYRQAERLYRLRFDACDFRFGTRGLRADACAFRFVDREALAFECRRRFVDECRRGRRTGLFQSTALSALNFLGMTIGPSA